MDTKSARGGYKMVERCPKCGQPIQQVKRKQVKTGYIISVTIATISIMASIGLACLMAVGVVPNTVRWFGISSTPLIPATIAGLIAINLSYEDGEDD